MSYFYFIFLGKTVNNLCIYMYSIFLNLNISEVKALLFYNIGFQLYFLDFYYENESIFLENLNVEFEPNQLSLQTKQAILRFNYENFFKVQIENLYRIIWSNYSILINGDFVSLKHLIEKKKMDDLILTQKVLDNIHSMLESHLRFTKVIHDFSYYFNSKYFPGVLNCRQFCITMNERTVNLEQFLKQIDAKSLQNLSQKDRSKFINEFASMLQN